MSNVLPKRLLPIVLAVALAFNTVDRLALGLLAPKIARDLALSDTQLGFISGLAFALFYSLMGVQIARFADRGNRVAIIAASTLAWSVGVAACGLAQNFWQLAALRMFVAVGEAGLIAPAHSLIADYFDRRERIRAVSTFLLGAPCSVIVGYFAAGWAGQELGWRWAFAIMGLPGVAVALAVGYWLKEPRNLRRNQVEQGRRLDPNGAGHESSALPGLWAATRQLLRSRTFTNMLLCLSIAQFFGSGLLQWQPMLLQRSYGLGVAEIGMWLSLIYGIGGVLGTALGGSLFSRLGPNFEGLKLKIIASLFVAFGVFNTFAFWSSDVRVTLAFISIGAVGLSATSGPLFATVQTIVPEDNRALAIALIYFLGNLLGIGLGPLLVGFLSDTFLHTFGQQSLRFALLCVCPGYGWAAFHIWRASGTIQSDLAEGKADRPSILEHIEKISGDIASVGAPGQPIG